MRETERLIILIGATVVTITSFAFPEHTTGHLTTPLALAGLLLFPTISAQILYIKTRGRLRQGSIIPARLSEEDLGDAIEFIGELKKTGASDWRIRREVIVRTVWIIHNTLVEIAEAIFERLIKSRG